MSDLNDHQTASYITLPLLIDEECENGNIHHRNQGKTSFFRTCFNCLNTLSGVVGLLSVPYALSSGGWLSLILLFSIAATTFFTGILIKRCLDIDSEIKTYPDIGERSFGRTGRGVISMFMYLELYLVPTGFLILEGDSLHSLFPNVEFGIGGRGGFIVIVALIILPTLMLDDLSKLSYVSATGILAAVIVIVCVGWTAVIDGVRFQEKGKVLNWGGIPSAFSLYTFCYCAHPVFPTLYTSMKNKSQFNKVLLVCFVLSTAGYTSIAILGYGMFGDEVKSQVTLNLPIEAISSKIAIYATLINPLTKYALLVNPIVSDIENHLAYKKKLSKLVIRTLLLVSTILIAISFPFFGDLMSLVGALLSATASIIFPCLCYLKISGIYKRWSFELVVIVIIIYMGISMAIAGTYTSLRGIIYHL